MVKAGYSPSVRLFEAAACGSVIISDTWKGLDRFFTPAAEILLSRNAAERCRYLREIPEEDCRQIGARARVRVLGATPCSTARESWSSWSPRCGAIAPPEWNRVAWEPARWKRGVMNAELTREHIAWSKA